MLRSIYKKKREREREESREKEKGEEILEEKKHLRNGLRFYRGYRALLRGVFLKPAPGKSFNREQDTRFGPSKILEQSKENLHFGRFDEHFRKFGW